mmetsp:Transcript_38901/g.82824  ORF Transcript_38901/g.82824 Transcript_38901/m.82824 type:complete len:687 (-) Transcript_38901:43-2103(-)
MDLHTAVERAEAMVTASLEEPEPGTLELEACGAPPLLAPPFSAVSAPRPSTPASVDAEVRRLPSDYVGSASAAVASALGMELPTPRPLPRSIEAEHIALATSVQDLHMQQVQALEVMTERVDLKVGRMADQAGLAAERLVRELEERLEKRFVDFEASIASQMQVGALEERLAKRCADLEEQLRKLGLDVSARQAANDNESSDERQELFVAVATVCRDIQALQSRNSELASACEALKGRQSELGAACESLPLQQRREFETGLAALRGEIMRSLANQAGNVETLRQEQCRALEELRRQQRQAFEELGSQRLATIEAEQSLMSRDLRALQGEDRQRCGEIESLTRSHQADIEALQSYQSGLVATTRSQLQGGFEAAQAELARKLEANRAQLLGEVETLRGQLQKNCGEADARLGQQAQAVEAIKSQQSRYTDALRCQLLSEMDAMRSQMGEVKTTLAAQCRDASTWAASWRVLEREVEALKGREGQHSQSHGAEVEALRGQPCLQSNDLQALRRIEAMQSELVNDVGAVKGQLIDNVKALRSQLSKTDDDVEAVRAQLRSSSAMGLRGGEAMTDAAKGHLAAPWELTELRACQDGQSVAIEKLGSRVEAIQSQLMRDVGAIKGQLIDNMKALHTQHGQLSTDLEALRSARRPCQQEAAAGRHDRSFVGTGSTATSLSPRSPWSPFRNSN